MTLLTCDVAVVGGGPVGLCLAASLIQRGIDARVIERSPEPTLQSRAIGIHPPGLACLASIGVADALTSRGVMVRRARAFVPGKCLGAISFTDLPSPYTFVLTVPQAQTEALLQQRVHELSPAALMRGYTCDGIAHEDATVRVHLSNATGQTTLEAKFVVGCDGKHSVVRKAIRVPYPGSAYHDHFLMGDLPDETEYGPDAAVFLHPEGLVESFPLPGQKRRWVVATGARRECADADVLAALVARRADHRVRADQASLVSSFTAEHYLATRFARKRTVLAGDAAHVVSPIGGQGMNLGWLDASALSPVLTSLVRSNADPNAALARYSRTRRRAAKAAIGRAELFMGIGRARPRSLLRDGVVRAMLRPELRLLSARLFTMWRL